VVRENCYQSEVSLVSDLYTSQPSAIEAYNTLAAEYRDKLIACLENAGVDVDPAAPIDEIVRVDSDAFHALNDPTSQPCVMSTGFLAAQNGPR
jgi:hypothetical protein